MAVVAMRRKSFLLVLALSTVGTSLVSCSEMVTGAKSAFQIQPRRITESSGFYWDADSGKYAWDGQVPSGDASPSSVYDGKTIAVAPSMSADGTAHGGGAYGFASCNDCDKIKIDGVYSLYADGSPTAYQVPFTGGWRYCGWIGMGHCQGFKGSASKQLSVSSNVCNTELITGGSAQAEKTTPFGLTLQGQIWIFGGNAINSWGNSGPQPLDADDAYGVPCDNPPPADKPSGAYQCLDQQGNPIQCPSQDPATTPGGSGVQVSGQDMGTSAASGGYLYQEFCHNMDFYVKVGDGPRVFMYHEQYNCYSVMVQ